MIPGIGTVVNVATVLLGSTIGVLLGNRLPVAHPRRRDRRAGPGDAADRRYVGDGGARRRPAPTLVGDSAPMLIVLGALLVGGIVGSLLRLESRVEALGGWLQARLSGDAGSAERHRFIEGFVVSSLVFCTGPLTILGSLNDGLGQRRRAALSSRRRSTGSPRSRSRRRSAGAWPPARVTIVVVQGGLTLLGLGLGDVLPDAHLAAITATGGLLLVGVALRLLRVREIPVADLLPALLVAPILVAARGARFIDVTVR